MRIKRTIKSITFLLDARRPHASEAMESATQLDHILVEGLTRTTSKDSESHQGPIDKSRTKKSALLIV